MPHEEDALELHKEWRAIVLAKLDSLEKGQKKMEDDLVILRMQSVRGEEYTKLENRVRGLEDMKVKLIATWTVLQGASIFVAWLISFIWKSH